MKYILFIVLLASCNVTPNGEERVLKDNNTKPAYYYRIVVIDGCQYIEINVGVGGSSMYGLTHKGDCNNQMVW